MLTSIAAAGTAAMLAVASWAAATATPTAPAPTPTHPVTLHAAAAPAGGHHARACADDNCTAIAAPDPAPATAHAAIAPGTDTPTVRRSDCPQRSAAGYRIDTPGTAPLLALALDSRDTHAGLHATAPDRARSATACAG